MKFALQDTIAAIATPLGEAGLGIIRLSGPQAIQVSERIFRANSKIVVSKMATHTVHLGWIVNKRQKTEQVLLTVMKAPRSYTGEDVVEISAHGGTIVLQRILNIALQKGARLAQPGEFTKRAFLNGKIDLSQAEAVVDIIKAKTEEGLRLAVNQLTGNISFIIKQLKTELTDLIAAVEASIDFSQEDLVTISRYEMETKIRKIINKIDILINSFTRGKIFREGIKIAIVGKTNVGKSSVLNSLLKEEKAIVTSIPGTTRDTVEDYINIKGIPVKIIDTAGLKSPRDEVEKIGVKRAYRSIEKADLILFVIDTATDISKKDQELSRRLRGRPIIIVANKIDLKARINKKDIKKLAPKEKIVFICALTGDGIAALEKAIQEMIFTKTIGTKNRKANVVITNQRHQEALQQAKQHLLKAKISLKESQSEEFIALDLRACLEKLGLIIGEAVTEDILNNIFSKFCIGK